MPTFTSRLNLEKINQSEYPNTWGVHEGAMKDRIDDAIRGQVRIAVSGAYTLKTAIDTTDEVHYGSINVTGGTGGTLTVPLKEAEWTIYNGSTGDLTITNGADGAVVAVIHPTQLSRVWTDGVSICRQLGWGNGNPKDYVDNILVQSKAYTDEQAFAQIDLPGQAGNPGKYLQTDGFTSSWQDITSANITDLQATINNLIGFAIAVKYLG